MQKDSEPCSSSGHVMHNQAVTEECPVKAFQCSHCTLIFKSKVYLFEHLNKVHGFDVDTALKDAGLKHAVDKKINRDNKSSVLGAFLCQHCDFKTCHQDVLNKHEKQCPKNADNKKGIGSVHISDNPETKITVGSTNQHKEGAGANEISSFSSVMSTSKTKCLLNSSKDLKTYKRPLQTITKYFTASSRSNGKLPVKLSDNPVLPDSTKGTLILEESPSNSSGVFKVTAKSMIDITSVSDQFLLNDHLLITDTRPQMQKEESKETVPNTAVKRTNNESSKVPPAKKAKTCTEEKKPLDNTKTSKQQSSSMKFSFEISEDDEESIRRGNRDAESLKVYFCKQCDYGDVGIRNVSNHYLNSHPYVRYNSVYIQDPDDQSATFRCLECPVEFLSIPELKRHYTENHPKAPDVFTVQLCELNLVFKCFVCPFISNTLKDLKEHYKGIHPTHQVDNSLLYCRYSVTRCQGASSQLNTCEPAPNPEKFDSSPETAHTPCEEVKNAPSPQHTASRGADMALYHCNNCNFSHKSVVVMHVHYHKSHPNQPVTIDKIKRSHPASEVTPEKSQNSVKIIENCTPEKNTPECLKKAEDKGEPSQQNLSLSSMRLKHTPEASKTCSKSPRLESAEDRSKTTRQSLAKHEREVSIEMNSSPNKMFYCQFCSYSSINIRSVIGHHNAKHTINGPTSTEDLLCYSAMVQKKKLQSETTASASTPTSDSKTGKQLDVRSKKKLQYKQDDVGEAPVKALNAYECAENLFYCQKCNFGNPSLKGVLNHQCKIHRRINSNSKCILKHTALMREEVKKSKSQTKELSFGTHLPLPIMNEGDENMFFCHFCNYRHSTMDQVLRHYFKSHHGFEVKAEYVHLHTSQVLEQTQKLHLKTAEDLNPPTLSDIQDKNKKMKKLVKSFPVSVPPSVKASQTQRTLKCHRCSYVTQYLYVLRRHMWKVHRSNRSCGELLRLCFKQGNVQSGYHCDLCVFSHKTAAAVYKHHQEQHPERKLSLEYISTRLYVGPETSPSKREKPQVKRTDNILPSQRSVGNETKTYSCKACSFKGSSMSSIASHYRAVHPWSVKEDGSVLGVRTSKKRSANRQLQNNSEILESFDTYQIPLEFDKSPDSSREAKEPPREFKCSFCPASFYTQHSLSVHCGMKHQGAVTKTSNEQREKQIQTRVHVFKCLHCNYINSNYQGVLTHCQMKHPSLTSRADSLHVDKLRLKSLDNGIKRSGDSLRYRGYMCKTCQQVYATVEKLNKHYEKYHKHNVQNPVSNILKPGPQPAVSKIQQSMTYSAQGSKVSYLRKKIYAVLKCQQCNYSCSTKIALSRHLRIHHRNPSILKVKDCAYKCALCSQLYFRKKHLESHYIKKHGKDAFFKYCVTVHKQVPQKSVPTSPDYSLTQPPESTSEACESSTTTEKSKILAYKCPTCPYVNASYHGTLTHCQMMHPDLVARADGLQTTEILVTNMVMCTMGKGSNERGYMCNKCPQIHASLVKLKIHSARDHDQAEPAASEHLDEKETEEQADHSSLGSLLEADSLKNKISAVNTTEIDLHQQLGTIETCQPNEPSVQNKEPMYKCHMCNYTGICRKYLYCHYKYTHKLDALSMYKQLEKYNKRKRKFRKLMEAEPESAHVKCKKCPNLTFDTSRLLIAHYSTFHRYNMDFTVLSQRTKRSTGSYKCSHCKKHIHGIRNLCCHLDRHRARRMKRKQAAERQASSVVKTTPDTKCNELYKQGELPLLESVEELAKWNVTPVKTFDLPLSPLTSPSKPTDREQPETESRDYKHSCKQCRRTFMSLKGLRSHERSHAALAAIKKLDNLPPSALKHNINEYILYKSGNLRPFVCTICCYRTTVLGLWRSHFMKKHQDVLVKAGETDNQDENGPQRVDREPPYSTEEMKCFPEPDEEPEVTEKSLYLEPPDVQRQLNQYSFMAQIDVSSKANLQKTMLPENCLLHCEFCSFNSGHLSSMRRHYLNRHGRKILRCKDCDFFTGIRKTLERHMETGHSTFQSEPTHQKDLRCPFCLYQTKNKNNMIDHIILHREERVVPIEVRRSKLSHYLQGIVFRCHKCTFSSGSAENLRLHMMRHNDIKPYRCRLCYFDCTQLNDLEAHLSDKHQVVRNHELVGQVSLDQLEATVCRLPEEESFSNLEQHNSDRGDAETEDLDVDCNEVLQKTLANNMTQNDIWKKTTVHMMEADQKHEQDPQEQAGVVLLSDTATGQRVQIDGNPKNADFQFEDLSGSEEEIQKEYQAQPKQTDSEDKTIKLISPKEETTEWSPAESGEKAAEIHTPHITALQHRVSNIKALVEDDIPHHIQALDEEGYKKDRTIKTEQNSQTGVVDNILSEKQLLDDEGNSGALKCKSPVNAEAISGLEIKNMRAQGSLKVEKQLLTFIPSCTKPKISHKGNFKVSFANCKEEVHSQKNSEEVTESYREMPVLEKAFLKEEMHPLGRWKEEEETCYVEQKQLREDEMIIESKNECKEEGARIEEADNPHVHRGTAMVGAPEVLGPSVTENKQYTCEFCGRNLLNSCELTRHVMRHGI